MSETIEDTLAPLSRALALVPALPEVLVGKQVAQTEKLLLAVESLVSRIGELERGMGALARAISELSLSTMPAPPLLDPQYTRRFRRNI